MLRKVLTSVGLVLVGLFAYGMVYAALNPEGTVSSESTFSQTAKDNTFRNAFISSCVTEASTSPDIDAQSYCGCGYDKLVEMYPDFTTNEERLDRILAEGYNQSETDIIVTCLQ